MELYLVLGIIGFVVIAFVYTKQKEKKEMAELIAANEAAWAVDWHNPASPNYDPVRVEEEQKAFYEKLGLPWPPV